MESTKNDKRFDEHGLPRYLDMQARIGYTKHIGGIQSTRQLLDLCEVTADKTVLNVGCGGGATNLYLAETYGNHSVGVDLKENMVATAQGWAQRKGLSDKTEFRQASATDLPFEDNSFDIVISESVNIFVPDRPKAIAEYKRVVTPGGVVGLNEPVQLNVPTAAVEKMMADIIGYDLFLPEYWHELLSEAGLEDIVSKIGTITIAQDSRNQLAFFGKGEFLIILGRMLKALFSDPYTRSILRQATGNNLSEYTDYMGYGLFVGRRPNQ
ncbi:class I SAM-dependent methyltransferase [Chloroflexota bacterium]